MKDYRRQPQITKYSVCKGKSRVGSQTLQVRHIFMGDALEDLEKRIPEPSANEWVDL